MNKPTTQVVNAIRTGDGEAGRVVGHSLKDLRELLGLTQAEMARRLDVPQSGITNIETAGDVPISSLAKYVEALGAKLNIAAVFPSNELSVAHLKDVFDRDTYDDDQLCFSIFGDDLFRPHRDVVLSIRPEYSHKIIAGKKTVELRRRFPLSAPRGTVAYIYSTSPDQAMVGRAEIAGVSKLPVAEIWKRYSKHALIDRSDFDSYFEGLTEGFALKFENAKPLPRHLELSELRNRFGFEPPQSFLYAKPGLRVALHHEYSNLHS
jgi:predicted transcriptional regulator/DNA-binding XRE family transcriptional regulator